MSQHWTFNNHQKEIIRFKQRSMIAVVLIIAFSCTLLARLIYLQVIEHQVYSTLSQQNLLTIIPIEPNRGLIYDRNGVLLAKNLPSFNLSVIPARIKNLSSTITELEHIIAISPEDLATFQKRRSQYRPYQPVPLKNNLNEEEVAEFYVNQYRFPGVVIQSQLLRQYPHTDLLSAILGYVGRINQQEQAQIDMTNYSASDYIGKTGIEKQYEEQLHGKVGNEEVETDASGRTVRVLRRQAPIPGQNLYLTIDAKLQQVAQQALGAESGSIVALDPNTGEVLAMVSNPSYDPNLFVTGISEKNYQALLDAPEHPLYNRALRGLFAPGSTIKPFYALEYLNQKIITPDTHFFDTGKFSLPNSTHIFHDWIAWGHGWVNVSRAITVSCDVFFYTFAAKAGIDRLHHILNEFGFGQPTGIDLPKELAGLSPSAAWKKKVKDESWYPGDTVNVGIGQGYLMVTPLQLAQATGILATRGQLAPLHLLLKAINPNNTVFTPHYPVKQVVKINDPKIWQLVINAMQAVISAPEGTASHFGKDAPYTAAGKTGTAQIYGKKGDEEKELPSTPRHLRNNHLFISFAPVAQPQIVVAVVMEHAAGADAVARQVMDYYFEQYPSKNPETNPAPNPTINPAMTPVPTPPLIH